MLLFESHFSARVNGSPNVLSKTSQALSNGPLSKLFIYSIIIPENWDFLPVFQPMVVCCNLGFRCCSLARSSRLVGMAVVDNADKERGPGCQYGPFLKPWHQWWVIAQTRQGWCGSNSGHGDWGESLEGLIKKQDAGRHSWKIRRADLEKKNVRKKERGRERC